MRTADTPARVIVFGVTIDYQLRYHEGLYQRLVDDGWQVHLISGAGAIGDRLAGLEGIVVHRLSMAREPRPLADLRALWHWTRLLRQIRPSVVVVGSPKAGLVGSLAARLMRVPARVYELLGLRLESTSGITRRVLQTAERLACGSSTKVIAVGSSLRKRAIEERLVSDDRIEVLGSGSPDGVDVDHFVRARADVEAKRRTRADLRIGEGVPVVVFVGRLTADKGLGVLGEAMRQVQERSDAHLMVVGPIDDDSGRTAADGLRTALPRVTFAGDVSDVAPYLAISDVFCLPSRREGLSTVVLEAFASGVPVVATAATGIVDVVNSETGLLVPIDDAESLRAAISEALEAADAAATRASAAKALVREEFATDVVRARWISMLDSLHASIESKAK